MDLDKDYKHRARIIANSSKPTLPSTRSPTRPPQALKLAVTLPLAPASAAQAITSTLATAPPSHTFKWMTPKEMANRHRTALCFNCNKMFRRGHKCKHLFDIAVVNIYDLEEPNLMMITSGHAPSIEGSRTKHLAGTVSCHGVRILLNIGTTHNVLDIFAKMPGIT